MPALWKAPAQAAQLIEKEGNNKELFLFNDWSSVQPLGNTEFFCKWQNFETSVQKKAALLLGKVMSLYLRGTRALKTDASISGEHQNAVQIHT